MRHPFSEIAAAFVHPIKSDLGVQGDINIHAIFSGNKTAARSCPYQKPNILITNMAVISIPLALIKGKHVSIFNIEYKKAGPEAGY
jgi:hypothetical protein